MKIFSRVDLRKKLQKREIAPVYLLFGDEVYLRDLAVKTITQISLSDSPLPEFNDSEISLSASSLAEALAAARQIPMLGPRRVIRVSNVVISAIKSKDSIKEEDAVELANYLKHPSESSVLIFVADELDKRRKVSKLLLNNSFAVEFGVLSDQEMIAWSKEKLRGLRATADEKTLESLVAHIGNDLRKLTIELEKLATSALPDSKITAELVDALAPNSRELSNFDLGEHLLLNRKSKSLSVLKKLLDDGSEPLMLLGLLSYNFRSLFMVKELMEEGADEKEIGSVVRMPWDKRKSFIASALRTDRKRLEWILTRIAKTDKAIKTSEATPRLQLEMLVCELLTH